MPPTSLKSGAVLWPLCSTCSEDERAPHRQVTADLGSEKLRWQHTQAITRRLSEVDFAIPPEVENTRCVNVPSSTLRIHCSYVLCFSLLSSVDQARPKISIFLMPNIDSAAKQGYRLHGLVSAYAYFQNCKEICAYYPKAKLTTPPNRDACLVARVTSQKSRIVEIIDIVPL